MVALPKRGEQQLIDRIYASYEKAESSSRGLYLGRLGASFIGEECFRKIWLSWRAYAVSSFNGRMLRLFATGHWQEARVVDDLRAAGLSVWDKDTETGEQIEYTDKTGHFIVKLDGVVKGVPESEKSPHVLEIKTHNKNSFAGLVKHGVRAAKPTHFAQLQAGMMLSGIERGLYVSVCKDDEQFYVERVKPDREAQEQIGRRIVKLVEATIRPAGVSVDGDSFVCKYCDMKEVCVGNVAPLRTCRSCVHADPGCLAGEWVCSKSGETLTKEAQKRACDDYEVL